MRLLITKEIPTKEHIELYGMYNVLKITPKKNFIIKAPTGRRVYIYSHEGKLKKGLKMKLSQVAICIKYLEILKWRLLTDEFDTIKGKPVEYYHVNEFPFNSAFCYMFRSYKAKSPIDGVKCCFCPKRPDKNHKRLGITNGEGIKRINCVVNPAGKNRRPIDIIEEVKTIPLAVIAKFVQKVKVSKKQMRMITNLWYFHVRNKVTKGHIDSARLTYLSEYTK